MGSLHEAVRQGLDAVSAFRPLTITSSVTVAKKAMISHTTTTRSSMESLNLTTSATSAIAEITRSRSSATIAGPLPGCAAVGESGSPGFWLGYAAGVASALGLLLLVASCIALIQRCKKEAIAAEGAAAASARGVKFPPSFLQPVD